MSVSPSAAAAALTLTFLVLLPACRTNRDAVEVAYANADLQVASPDGELHFAFVSGDDGALAYRLERWPGGDSARRETLVLDSRLGFAVEALGRLRDSFEVTSASRSEGREEYALPWGETAGVEAGFGESRIDVAHAASGLRFSVVARVFDDGVGLRYAFPAQDGLDSLRVLEEYTEIRLPGDPLVQWGPGDWNGYENPIELTRLSDIDATVFDARDQLISRIVPENAVMTPVTMRLNTGTHLSLHEAHLEDYPEVTLAVRDDGFETRLVGTERRSAKAVRALPFETPWRTVAVEQRAVDFLDNYLALNLNPANELGDVSWFEPQTYAGVWWEMHLGVGTWDLAGGSTSPTPEAAAILAQRGVDSRHAANTANVKRYIDFCAENDIGGLLVEGWNTGWEVWLDPEKRAEVFDFVTAYPDYDLEAVTAYAKTKNVAMIMHHETSASVPQYERQQDTAYALMQRLGIHAAKTGYVGNILPEGEYRHGQYMVRHFRNTFRKAAKYQVAINSHEGMKQTGERRTLPNAISAENAKGTEYNSNGNREGVNPAAHLPALVYTRCLAGPFDYTPGIFRLELDDYRGPDSYVGTTLGQQLGSYIVIYAPVQMAADLPEHYKLSSGAYHPAMPFIRGLAVNWEATYPLSGELGQYAVVAREERGGEGRYFVGGVNGAEAREVNVRFDFLPPSERYTLTLYRDGEGVNRFENPGGLEIETKTVTHETQFTVRMGEAGGFAGVLRKR